MPKSVKMYYSMPDKARISPAEVLQWQKLFAKSSQTRGEHWIEIIRKRAPENSFAPTPKLDHY